MSPLGAALAFRLAALSLLLCAVAVHSASQRGNNAAKAEAEPAAAAARGPRRRLRSYCHPETAELIENGSTPLPCTEEQEIDALQDLYQELPDVQDPTQAVIDTSACNATDPEGYTQAVDLFNSGVAEVGGLPGRSQQLQDAWRGLFPGLGLDSTVAGVFSQGLMSWWEGKGGGRSIARRWCDAVSWPPRQPAVQVATTIGEEYVAAAGNESYWQTECNGDLTTDAYNACRQPQATEPQVRLRQHTLFAAHPAIARHAPRLCQRS